MSGLIDKIKSLISPERADQAADQVEQNVTDERIDQTAERVPGGERAAEHVPEDAGEKAGDTIRDAGGATEEEKKES